MVFRDVMRDGTVRISSAIPPVDYTNLITGIVTEQVGSVNTTLRDYVDGQLLTEATRINADIAEIMASTSQLDLDLAAIGEDIVVIAADANAALTSANGKNRNNFADAAPINGTSLGKPGDQWFVRASGNAPITAQYECVENNTWVMRELSSATIANLDVGKLSGGFIDVNHINVDLLVIGQTQVEGLSDSLADAATAAQSQANSAQTAAINAAAVTAQAKADAAKADAIASASGTAQDKANAAQANAVAAAAITAQAKADAALAAAQVDATNKANAARSGAVNDLKTLWGHPLNTTVIDGGKLYTGSVFAKSISIADFTNYLPPMTQWSLGDPVIIVDTDALGPYAVVMGNGSTNTHWVVNEFMPVTPGDEFRFQWDVYTSYPGYSGNGGLYVIFYRQDRSYLTEASGAFPNQNGSGLYIPYSRDFTVPADAYYMQFIPYVGANLRMAIRRCVLRRKNGGELIVDGAIKAAQLDANAVTAKHTLTGPIFQTTAEANRGIKIVGSANNGYGSMIAYNTSQVPVFTLNGQNGSIVMKGDLTSGSSIVGATFKTAVSGERLEINTATASTIKFYSGSGSESVPSELRADANGSSVYLMFLGPKAPNSGVAFIELVTNSSNNETQFRAFGDRMTLQGSGANLMSFATTTGVRVQSTHTLVLSSGGTVELTAPTISMKGGLAGKLIVKPASNNNNWPMLWSENINRGLMFAGDGFYSTEGGGNVGCPIYASQFYGWSDSVHKTNQEPVTGAMDQLDMLEVLDYDTPHGGKILKNGKPGKKKHARGVLAQHLQAVAPHLVINDETGLGFGLGVDIYGLASTTVAGLQEVNARVKILEALIKELTTT